MKLQPLALLGDMKSGAVQSNSKAMRSWLKWLIPLVLLFGIYNNGLATHLRAADVSVEKICGTLTFRITVTAYLNSNSSTRFGTGSEILFGDGTSVRIPVTNSVLRPDLGEDVSVATFTTTHTYSRDGVYKIAYIERDRSSGVLNIVNSGDTPYVSFVEITTASQLGCNTFPKLSVIPLDRSCSGVAFFHNSGAFDVDGDSLSYEMFVPSASANTFATYTEPNDQQFYTNFNEGNEDKNGSPTFTIDAFTGLVAWDAPGRLGEYNIAFKIKEWRKLADGSYLQLSTTVRDMQIVVEECENERPQLRVPSDTCVVAGTSLSAIIESTDVEGDNVKIEIFSETLGLSSDSAFYDPIHHSFVASPAEVNFNWQPTCDHVRQQPYTVTVKVTDDPVDGPKLITFKTWSIRVIAPAPELEEVRLNVVDNYGVLTLSEYPCNNVKQFQIWRKVGSSDYSSQSCEIGIRMNAGYKLIDVVSANTSSYVDTNAGMGLAAAATYCYRVVALVSDTRSQVSEEFCIGPVKADAPVITHVSVEKTSIDDGRIRISWRSPFEIDKSQFPEPYRYEVFRSRDFIGDLDIASLGVVDDTTITDANVNTLEEAYNYRIVLYAKPIDAEEYIPVDTSAVSSSVWLTAKSEQNGIFLKWYDSAAWSNVATEAPYHLIYRSSAPDLNENSMELLDSVNVLDSSFIYRDAMVDPNVLYAYKILTRGTYGNPLIKTLENFSQLVAIYPDNELMACPPLVMIESTDCNALLASGVCKPNEFKNHISWTDYKKDEACRLDVVAFKIYASETVQADFVLIDSVTTSEYIDLNLNSWARCYRVSAIDSRGREGPLSDPVCNDNCPYFELPNVFTPNNDGCNDVFTARYDDAVMLSENCPLIDKNKCARFVDHVHITIYNRWGRVVFKTDSNDGGSLFVDWDGRDNAGNLCAPGVYYYTAKVTFEVVDTNGRIAEYKGWVQLIK